MRADAIRLGMVLIMATPRKANPKKGGRPTSFTKELAGTICRRIADGESLRSICKSKGMPEKETVRRWCSERPAFYAQYRQARENQADSLFEEGLDTARKAKTQSQASCANVRLRAIIWAASKLNPKRYGDKTTVEHAGGVKQTLTHDVRPSLARMMNDPVAWRKAKDLSWMAGVRPATNGNGHNGNGHANGNGNGHAEAE